MRQDRYAKFTGHTFSRQQNKTDQNDFFRLLPPSAIGGIEIRYWILGQSESWRSSQTHCTPRVCRGRHICQTRVERRECTLQKLQWRAVWCVLIVGRRLTATHSMPAPKKHCTTKAPRHEEGHEEKPPCIFVVASFVPRCLREKGSRADCPVPLREPGLSERSYVLCSAARKCAYSRTRLAYFRHADVPLYRANAGTFCTKLRPSAFGEASTAA